MINKNDMINVLNESTSPCYGISAINEYGYKFQPCNDLGEPSFEPVPFSDIQYMNNKSEVFRTGTLRFEEDVEDDVYKSLNIRPKSDKNYYTLQDIEDIIINPTMEKLEDVKKITSVITIEKFRGVLTRLNNEDEYDIAQRVFDVINLRWDEISIGRLKSEIVIKKKRNEQKIDKETEIETKSTNVEVKNEEKVEKPVSKKNKTTKG
jgi:hypothetical protein